jgi:hypothetical protein
MSGMLSPELRNAPEACSSDRGSTGSRPTADEQPLDKTLPADLDVRFCYMGAESCRAAFGQTARSCVPIVLPASFGR